MLFLTDCSYCLMFFTPPRNHHHEEHISPDPALTSLFFDLMRTALASVRISHTLLSFSRPILVNVCPHRQILRDEKARMSKPRAVNTR